MNSYDDDRLFGGTRETADRVGDAGAGDFSRARGVTATARRDRDSRRKRTFSPGVGAALVLTALICICLLCYAALTVVSAQADLRLTEKYAEQTTGYYEAFGAGQEFLAGINAQLKAIYEEEKTAAEVSEERSSTTETSTEDSAGRYYAAAALLEACVDPDDVENEWYDEIQSILANTVGAVGASGEAAAEESSGAAGVGDTGASYSAPLLLFTQEISDTQTYLLLVRVQYPGPGSGEAGAFYEILASKTVATITYDYDATLNVITE